jgi:hypothetical protein
MCWIAVAPGLDGPKESNVMQRVSGCGEFEGDVLLADWEVTGADSLRADVCVPAVQGLVRPGAPELSSMVVLEVCRLGTALVAQRSAGVAGEWCFVLQSFTLEWHGLPPSIPALGAIWCELVVEAVAEPVNVERELVTWSCTLTAAGRPLVAGHLRGWLTTSTAEMDATHMPPHALVHAVLSAARVRSPGSQVHIVEMSFGDVAVRDADLDLELTWDPDTELNLFSISQGGHAVATARVGLFGREPLSIAPSRSRIGR